MTLTAASAALRAVRERHAECCQRAAHLHRLLLQHEDAGARARAEIYHLERDNASLRQQVAELLTERTATAPAPVAAGRWSLLPRGAS